MEFSLKNMVAIFHSPFATSFNLLERKTNSFLVTLYTERRKKKDNKKNLIQLGKISPECASIMMQKDPGTLFFTSGATEKWAKSWRASTMAMGNYDVGEQLVHEFFYFWARLLKQKEKKQFYFIEYAQSVWENQYHILNLKNAL